MTAIQISLVLASFWQIISDIHWMENMLQMNLTIQSVEMLLWN